MRHQRRSTTGMPAERPAQSACSLLLSLFGLSQNSVILGRLTLARKLDAVHRKTVTISNVIPRVLRAIPPSPSLDTMPPSAFPPLLEMPCCDRVGDRIWTVESDDLRWCTTSCRGSAGSSGSPAIVLQDDGTGYESIPQPLGCVAI